MRAIITFHSIDDSGSVLSYPTRLFERLIDELNKKSVPIVDLTTLLGSQESGIALTFDDGMRSIYSNALPILKAYSFESAGRERPEVR